MSDKEERIIAMVYEGRELFTFEVSFLLFNNINYLFNESQGRYLCVFKT